jgi:hypothetical protein
MGQLAKHKRNQQDVSEAMSVASEFQRDSYGKGVGVCAPIEAWQYQRWCRILYDEVRRLQHNAMCPDDRR